MPILQLIHRNRRSVGVVVIVALVCLLMTGFGVNIYSRSKEVSALTVNGHKFDFPDVNSRKKELEERARQMFGDQYYKILESMGINLNQQVVDQMIESTLLTEDATKKGLHVSDDEVVAVLQADFQGNASAYNEYLARMEESPAAFESKLRDERLLGQYLGILSDVSLASRRESTAALVEERTKYSFQYFLISPSMFEKDVKPPTDEELTEFYKSVSGEFELPQRVSYRYVAFDPSDSLASVPVENDDVEMYYSDHQSDFSIPAKIKARHIEINYPKDAKPDDVKKAKERADEALAKAQAGEPFDELARKYSDDEKTKNQGGDLGWLSPGTRDTVFDNAAFKLEAGEVSALLQRAPGFEIVKLDDKENAGTKPLKDVRPLIEEKLKKRDAPSFTSEKAHAVFDDWTKTGTSLEDAMKQHSLAVHATNGLLSKDADPDPALKGLTSKILADPQEKNQLIELGDKTIIVSITDFKDAEIPTLESVREKVAARFKQQKAAELARAAGEKALAQLHTAPVNDLAELAKTFGAAVKSEENISREKPGTGFMKNESVAKAVFSIATAPRAVKDLVQVNGDYALIEVRSIDRPNEASVSKDIDARAEKTSGAFAELLERSVITKLKTHAAIDVNPSLLAP